MDRVQWFRYQAQMERWTEEVDILRAELKRTKAFFSFWAGTWLKLVDPAASTRFEQGRNAYAQKVSLMYTKLASDVPEPSVC